MMDFSLRTYKNDIVTALSDFIKIPSVKADPVGHMPYGKNVFDALMYVLNLAERLDFESVNMFSHVGYVEYGHGDDLFVILTHIDVVPAGDGWQFPPFGGVVQDGRIYGRGAVDDKGAAICALYVLHALKENCKNLNKRIRLIFGCDEESGWTDMDFYRRHEPAEPAMAISPDANFPLINGEKGLLQVTLTKKSDISPQKGVHLTSLQGGDRVNIVPNEANCFIAGDPTLLKRAFDLYMADLSLPVTCRERENGIEITAQGKAAHGSKPQLGENAVMRIVSFLNTLPLTVSAAADAVYALSRCIGDTTDGSLLGIAAKDATMGDLTVNVGRVTLCEDKAEIALDIRYPRTTDEQTILERISQAFCGFTVQKHHAMPPHYVQPDSPLVQGLLAAYEEVTGQSGKPYCIGGATYARIFKNSVAFGPIFPGQPSLEHQKDEYIDIDSLIRAGDVMANAILRLCT